MATAAADISTLPDDPIEQLFERGVTDGLPAVPPTRDRVERMLAGAPTGPGMNSSGRWGRAMARPRLSGWR